MVKQSNQTKGKITLENIKNYLQGNYRKVLLEYYPDGLASHIEEQYYWRIGQVRKKSPECLEKGKCKVCSCDTPELFLADKACENNPPCYPEMMNEKEWEDFCVKESLKPSKEFLKKIEEWNLEMIELNQQGLNYSNVLETKENLS